MATAEKLSFAAGEVSPNLRARRDLARQQAGVVRAENMLVLLEGGLTRAPGTRFIAPYKDEAAATAYVPLQYTATTGYMLVLNGGVIRFLTNGGLVTSAGVPYEIAHPYAAPDLANLRWASVGNLIFLACKNYAPRVITRSGALNWTIGLYLPTDGPVDVQNLDTNLTLKASAFSGAITLTANTFRFMQSDVGRVFRLDEPDLTLVPQWTANEVVAIGDQRRNAGNVYEAQNAVTSGVNPPTHTSGTVSSGAASVSWKYLHSGYGFVTVTAVAADFSLTASAVVNSRLPNSTTTVATYRWSQGSWSQAAGYPEFVAFDRNRLLWGRGSQEWETASGDFYSFRAGTDDAASIAARLVPNDGSLAELRWAVSAGVLMVGAARQEWSIRGKDFVSAPVPTAINPIVESGEGAASAMPAVADAGVVFIGSSRQRLHVARINPQTAASSVEVDEITLSARHILNGNAIRLAYQRDPNRVLWVACANGDLRAVTLLEQEKTVGWARRPFVNGAVEEIAVLPSTDEARTDVYLGVRRTINGVTRRYIEVMAPFFAPIDDEAPTAAGAWFVDCGLGYDGAPATVFSGLDHLAGESVRVFADGIDRGLFTVSLAGTVTLPQPASKVTIGLPQTWKVKPLPFELESQAGPSKGKQKRTQTVIVDMALSAGGKIAANDGDPEPLYDGGALGYAAPAPLVTGARRATLLAPAGPEALLTLIGDDAYPFTLSGLSPDIDILEG